MTEKNVLITTSLQQSYPVHGKRVYLGPWCYSVAHNKQEKGQTLTLNQPTLDLQGSVDYIDRLTNRIIQQLQPVLNELHRVDKQEAYWDWLLRHWLDKYINSQFMHWSIVQNAIKQCRIDYTCILENYEENLLSNTYLIETKPDVWLHSSFAHILDKCTNIECVELKSNDRNNDLTKSTHKKSIIQQLAIMLNRLPIYNDNTSVLCSTAIPSYKQVFIEVLSRQVPFGVFANAFRNISVHRQQYDASMRAWSLESDSDDKFEKYIYDLIPQRIPKDIIEDYNVVGDAMLSLPFPRNPSNIILGDWPKTDPVMMRWTAETRDKSESTCLSILQHGGNYGMDKYQAESVDVKICDRYYSWGWSNANSKILPLHYHKKNIKKQWNKESSRLTLVIIDVYLLPNTVKSWLPERYFNYLRYGICAFVSNLNNEVFSDLWVRGFKNHTGVYEHLKYQYPTINIDDTYAEKNSAINCLKQSKLMVMTYNSTFLQEAILSDIPTITAWSEDLIPLTEDAVAIFEIMENAGIHHTSLDSAAKFANSIWDNIEEWWNSKEVVSAKELFITNYARRPESFLSSAVNISRLITE